MENMTRIPPDQSDAWDIATRWCAARGDTWSLSGQLGVGGTAPVFELHTPHGLRALKLYDEEFSSGKMGEIEHNRIEQQLQLKDHDCSSLVQVYDGGTFEDRLFLLMSRAPGMELEKNLHQVPRSKIRPILSDVARACLFLHERGLCHRDIKAANVFVSEDFSHATLLDISVLRAIHDPVGVGSDHDGQLPVLATARYSPPECLFRLVDPGPQLWHALNIYQLGALLHDLIIRTPLFQTEYDHSKTNRYRFAWIVATQDPRIDATDIDQDLIFLARRALDKDWRRRSHLTVEGFLDDSSARQRLAFNMLGLYRPSAAQMIPPVQQTRAHLDEVAAALEAHLRAVMQQAGVTTIHQVQPGPDDDHSRRVVLSWTSTDEFDVPIELSLRCTLRQLTTASGKRFAMIVYLTKSHNGHDKCVEMEPPDIADNEHSSPALAALVELAFGRLAKNLLEPEHSDS